MQMEVEKEPVCLSILCITYFYPSFRRDKLKGKKSSATLITVAAPSSCGQRSDFALFGMGNLLYVSIGDERTELYTRTTWECH